MATRDLTVRHVFDGGWATDFGPQTDIQADAGGLFRIPFLVDAEDIVYELDGGPRKMPGTARLNSSALESGAAVRGVFDAWFHGSSGSPTQHRVVHVGTKIKEDDADGTFADLFTGLTSTSVPSYSMLEDLLVIAQDSADVPKSWDGTTAQNLAGSPPNFAFSAAHKNRLWAAGVDANPSRLFYSELLAPADWAGAGSGSIDIDPSDGDRITGIASHKNELWVFKGPYKGSIHRITGSSPSGDDAFARTTFVEGVGTIWHNAIFRFGDDLGFMWADGTVHSLSATAAFGDFSEATLSRPIDSWIKTNVTFNQLRRAWAVNDVTEGRVLFAVPAFGSSTANYMLAMDYRFRPPRWALWPSLTSVSLAEVVDASDNNRKIVMAGTDDGFVRKLGQVVRSIDGSTAIAYKVTTPFISYGDPFLLKTAAAFGIGIQPRNTGSFTFGWKGDQNSQRTESITQTAGVALGSFVLDTDMLGGSTFVDKFFDPDDSGEWRAVQYQISQAVNNEDLEVHTLGVKLHQGGESLEN